MNQQLIESAIGGNLRRCEACGKGFVQYANHHNPAKRCRRCSDIRQNKATVVEHREIVGIYPGLTIDESFPSDGWEEVKTDTGIKYKLDRRGAFGQIVVWATIIPVVGEVFKLRHMRATHTRNQVPFGTETHEYYVLIPERGQPAGALLVWDRSDVFPLRIRQDGGYQDTLASQPEGEYLGPATLAKLMVTEEVEENGE